MAIKLPSIKKNAPTNSAQSVENVFNRFNKSKKDNFNDLSNFIIYFENIFTIKKDQ